MQGMTTVVWDLKSLLPEHEHDDVFDCLLAEYVLSEGRHPLTKEATLEHYQVKTLEELASKQQAAFALSPDLSALFYEVELPLTKILWRMEQTGISLDQLHLQKTGTEISQQTAACLSEIQQLIKAPINLNSPAQLGTILVAQFKIPLPKTPSGQYATGESVLQEFKADYPIIQHLLTYRELTKLQTTYVTGLQKKVGPDGKIHTTYNQSAVITGRLSSSSPNLQNIPVTSLLGKEIKSSFVASPGMTLVAFDYSQQELRILAHMSGDQTLIDAFNHGQDIHKVTAAQIFAVPYDSVTKEQRSAAKTINFGIVYGMGRFGLSQQLRISVEEAAIFIDGFYAKFPGIKIFFDQLLKNGQRDNYISTILGRRRFVFNGSQRSVIDNNTRRELINFPIQGSAADFIKKSMVAVDTEIVQKNKHIRLLLQIHDELVFEIEDTDKAEMNKLIHAIHELMTHIYTLSVPMDVDIKIGPRWGSLEPFTSVE